MFLKVIDFRSVKRQLILFLTIFALFIYFKDKDLNFLFKCLISAFFATAIEAIFFYFKNKTLKFSDSAFITGIIVGYVLASDVLLWKFFFANFLAIASKYLIRFKNKHIFNPAAFGIFFTTIFLNVYTQWKGTYLWYFLIPAGLYFIYKVKRTELVASYLILSLLLFILQAFARRYSIKNIFGYFSYFYIFIMIIEPKTTPSNLFGKYLFGLGLAIFIFVLTEFAVRFDVELFSLLVMNLVSLLSKIKKGGSLCRSC